MWVRQTLVKAIAVTIMSTLVVAMAGATASAVVRTWYKKEAPLQVKAGSGSAALGAGHGSWNIEYLSDGRWSRGKGYVIDRNTSNNDGVYFKMRTFSNAGVCLAPQYTSCSQPWYYYTWDQMGEDDEYFGGSWSSEYVARTRLPSSGSYGSAEFIMCQDDTGNDTCGGESNKVANDY